MTTATVTCVPTLAPPTAGQQLIVVGTPADIRARLADPSRPLAAACGLSAADCGLLLALLDDAPAPAPFAGSTASTALALPAGGVAHVSLLLTPSAASRHNCPVRPDVIHRLCEGRLRTGAGRERVQVACMLPPEGGEASALAMGGAVARALHKYSEKTGGDTPADGGEPTTTSVEIAFVSEAGFLADARGLGHVTAAAEAIRSAAALVDMPCNVLNTTVFAAAARDLAADVGAACKIIAGQELADMGMGGIFGVGQAAAHPPALVILSHTPAGASETHAWCGKGIVYDTGGLSIKGKTFMPGMKKDMGGAAAILHAFGAAVRLGYRQNLHCLLAMAENAVGPLATRPDDVHRLYSGRTVEINNTDAEGRLVLGDAVAYAAKHLAPDTILDMCTLTGAQGISTGRRHASLVCSDEAWETRMWRAGRVCGDLVHPMPYCPELFSEEFKSPVADMKNSVKQRNNAQVSCAAQFIGNHLPGGWADSHPWIHVDMAGPAHADERGTGYGVAILLQAFVLGDLAA